MKSNKKIIIAVIVSLFVIIIAGCVGQFVNPDISGEVYYDSWGQLVQKKNISLNPIYLIKGLFTSVGLMVGAIFGIAIGLIYFLKKASDREHANTDERNFTRSTKGTYGTSGWMTYKELLNVLSVTNFNDTDGTVLGIDIETGKIISLPQKSRLNKHTAIFGASGTGKSRCFSRNQIIQCKRRGESIIVTDPKGELYADTSQYLRENGYEVKIFDLVDPQYSDSWNCLSEITANPNQIELMAQTFADIIIKNTGGNESKDPFWDTAEMNLLKALSLYVVLDEYSDESQKTIGKVYDMLTNNDEKKLNVMFDRLRAGHPAKAPWAIFKQAGDNVRGNVIIGLGARMQVFQSSIIKSITAYNEIDLEAPAKKKCAYYVIMSDQDSTLEFLSSLFFSFLFIRLVRYADIKGINGKCDIPVNFILDEFPNIGQIPDFTKKLSTIRSRELRVAVIFQNIAQLQNRYPNGLWEEIIGNCDTQLFLGCTDQMTAKFISTRTGEMTIEVNSVALQKQSIALTQNNQNYRETQSVGKRFVLTADEVLRWDKDYVLVIIRGEKVLKAKKFDFSLNPESKFFKEVNVRDYIPKWRADKESKKLNMQKAEEDELSEIDDLENAFAMEQTKEHDKEKAPNKEIEREVTATIPAKPKKLYSSVNKSSDSIDDF